MLQLQQIQVRNLADLDLIGYYLNFDSVSVALIQGGYWTVFYRNTCRHLDRNKFLCKVHDQKEQPSICVNYNPYACFYKKAHAAKKDDSGTIIWMSPTRFDKLQHSLEFDSELGLIQFPDWKELTELFRDIPYDESDRAITEYDPVLAGWKRSILRGNASSAAEEAPKIKFNEAQDPCNGCSAHCCTSLLFVHPIPETYADLDFFRYALGFPGLQLGISDSQWTLIARSRCRHLTPGLRCGLHGKPERPLTCRYYDASKCTYKIGFEQQRPAGYMRLTYSDFDGILDTFRFGEGGRINFGWNTDALRDKLEEKWRTRGVEI